MFQRSTVDDNQPRELAGMVLMEEQRIIIIMLMSEFYLIYNLWIIKVTEYTQANVTLISIVGSVVRYSITIKSLIYIYNGGIPGDVGFESILQRGCQQKK